MGRGRLYTYRNTVTTNQNNFCIKMGSDESHFNVSVGSDGQSHKRVSTNRKLLIKAVERTPSGIEPVWPSGKALGW